MARFSSTLLAAVCLQLLLSAGQVLPSSPEREHSGWTDKQCSAGRGQSPVDITSKGLKEAKIEPLIFEQYDVPFLTAVNFRDFSVSLLPSDDHQQPRPIVRGGDLMGNYVFAGLHFHWGPEGQQGSEHLLEGRQFDGEMHMVHYNDKYADLEAARVHIDGVAVLGTWLEAETATLISKNHSHHTGYQWMKKLAETHLSTDEEELTERLTSSHDLSKFRWGPLALKDILTPDLNQFFRYNGSLTTNPCSESVTWTVFRSPIIVPREFMKMLRQKETTVRAPQPLNNRTILYGGDLMTYYTGAGLATTPFGLWTLLPLFALLKMAL